MLFAVGEPPPNDQCDVATPIAGEGIFAFDNRFATEDLAERCDIAGHPPILGDVWYCWTATCNGLVSVDTCGGTTLDTMLQVYQGCDCPVTPKRSLICNDDACRYEFCGVPMCGFQSALEFTVTQGEFYLIRLGSSAYFPEAGSGATGTFVISCQPQESPRCPITYGNPQPPDQWNAWASDGETYRVADSFTPSADAQIDRLCWWGAYLFDDRECPVLIQEDAFEVRYYLDNGGVPGPLVGGPFGPHLALNMTARGRTGRTIMGDVREYQYSAEHSPVAVSAGQCYWIEITNQLGNDCVWHWEEGRGLDDRAAQQAVNGPQQTVYQPTDVIVADMALSLPVAITGSAVCATRPGNDDCAAAVFISSGQSVGFDTAAATTDGPSSYYGCSFGPPGCQDFPLGDEQVHRDIWFSYAAEDTGLLTVGTCDSLVDTKIVMYRNSVDHSDCPNSTAGRYEDFWNDDACSPGGPVTKTIESFNDAASPLPSRGISAESDCLVSHAAPFCDDQECAGRVCVYGYRNAYQNCCTQTWDGGCADVAAEICRDPAVSDLDLGFQSRIDVPVRTGAAFTIRVGGYRGQGGPGTLTVDLTPKGPETATLLDVASFLTCFTGECAQSACAPPLFAVPECTAYDADADGDVDRLDYVWISFALTP